MTREFKCMNCDISYLVDSRDLSMQFCDVCGSPLKYVGLVDRVEFVDYKDSLFPDK
jgi:hypothetical protein